MKTFRLFLLLTLVSVSYSSFGAWGHWRSRITTTTPYASNELHYFTKITSPVTEPGYNFHRSSLGRFTSADYINVNQAALWIYKNSGSDVCGATLNYRVYRTSDTPPAFTSLSLGDVCSGNCGGAGSGSDQMWSVNSPSLNFLSYANLPGTYVIEIYFEFTGNDGTCGFGNYTRHDNNNNSTTNYRAYFEYENTDSFTDSTFTSSPVWNSNNPANFLIIDNSNVSNLTGSEPSLTRTLRLNSSYTGGALESNYISTQIATWGTKQEWSFWHGRSSGASTTSQTYFWLYSTGADLNSNSISGYRIKFGDNVGIDEFIFQRVVNGMVTDLGTSSSGVTNGLTDFGISFRITRSSSGVWNVYTSLLPANSGDTQLSATAFGTAESNINVNIFNDLVDPVPLTINANGHFGFVATTNNNPANKVGQEFDNISFRVLPADTYFTFATSSSTIQESPVGTATLTVNINNPSTEITEVDIVLFSGDDSRLNEAYTTETLTWMANDNTPKSINLTAFDNGDCDDTSVLVFKLDNPSGLTNPTIGDEDTYTLNIIDDNMGYDDILLEDFEAALPAFWISTPSGRWSRSNIDAVGGTGYSLGHIEVNETDASSIAISLDSMPLVGVTTVWRFQVRCQQDGGVFSHWLTFLSANSTDLKNLAAVSGYAVGFNQNITGGTNDPLCLFKVTNGVSTPLINTGLDWIDNIGSNNAVSIEVTLDETGEWSMRLDLDGGFDNLTTYGASAIDLAHPTMNAFGSRLSFTSNFSNKFKLDDVSITQKGCRNEWWSQLSGNHNGNIWWDEENGLGNTTVATGSRFDRFHVKNGHTVDATGLWITESLDIESGGTLNANSSDVRLFGSWLNDGAFNRGTSTVTFRGQQNQFIFGSSITQFHNLVIDNDGGMVIATDSVLVRNVAYVNEGIFNANQKVGLFSNHLGAGSIGEIKPGASVVGLVTLHRYIPSIPYQYGNWFNLGNPLTGLTFAAWNASITTSGYPGSLYPPPYPFVNIRYYDEPDLGGANNGYQPVSNATDPIMTDRGYFVWLTGAAQNLRVTGNIQQGSLVHELSHSDNSNPTGDGWNLMTNPYPSEVDWNLVSSTLNGPRVYYVFDYQTNAYKYYNASNQTGSASRYIPHSQSFMVKVNTGGQQLHYEERYKTNNGTAFERSLGNSEDSFFAIQLERNGMLDENIIHFDDNSTVNYDSKDVLHLASPNENSIQMSCMTDDLTAVINDVRPYTGDVTIPVKVKMPSAGTYNLIISQVGNLPAGSCLFVEDIVSGQTMQLIEGAEMQVTVNAPFEGMRFRITGSAPAKVIATDATCFGVANGSLDVTVPANWSVKLNDEMYDLEYVSNGSVTLDGLRAGVYQLEVVNPDATCAAEVKTFNIGEPAEITTNITSTEQVFCNEGHTGKIAWITNNSEWFSFEIKDETNTTVQTAEVEGNSFIAESLASGLYTIKVYTECSTQTITADLRDANAPLVAVNAPQTVALGNEAVSVWLDATIANAQSVSWTLSNGQSGVGEMFEAVLENEGIHTYTATAKGMNCETTVTGSFEVKRLVLGSGANSSAITLLQQPEQMVLTFGAGQEEKATVRVLDANGKLVINRDVTGEEGQSTVMNTSNLSIGVYTIQVIKGNDVLFTQKVFRK